MKTYNDYVITKKIDLNLNQLKYSCYLMHDFVKKHFDKEMPAYDDVSGKTSLTTNLYNTYNLFMYPYDEFYNLYQEIKTLFHDCCIDEDQYYIQCWVNFYKKGDFIDWHNHWAPEHRTWHGFFCVDCEPSKTTYNVPGYNEPLDIVSENNLLVMSRSNGDTHRTWPWEDETKDRITIAFDIVPRQFIDPGVFLNHWVPI